jgi:hypothetical protein
MTIACFLPGKSFLCDWATGDASSCLSTVEGKLIGARFRLGTSKA